MGTTKRWLAIIDRVPNVLKLIDAAHSSEVAAGRGAVSGPPERESLRRRAARSEIRLGPHSRACRNLDVTVHQGCFAFPQLHRRARDHQVEDVRHPPGQTYCTSLR